MEPDSGEPIYRPVVKKALPLYPNGVDTITPHARRVVVNHDHTYQMDPKELHEEEFDPDMPTDDGLSGACACHDAQVCPDILDDADETWGRNE